MNQKASLKNSRLQPLTSASKKLADRPLRPLGWIPEETVVKIAKSDILRENLVRLTDRLVYRVLKKSSNPPGVKRDEWLTIRGLVHSFNRAIKAGTISDDSIRALVHLARARTDWTGILESFKEEYCDAPPGFLVVSPGRECNLDCKGCYDGTEEAHGKLSYDVFSRILREAKDLYGMSFIVISGGEPFVYKSDGKGILDAIEEYPDLYFLIYTNGTLITKEVSQRMGKLGNVTVAVSVEGLAQKTDQRRGKGVFDWVVKAFKNLRDAGVFFGLSLTATRENCEEIVSDEFFDFYLNTQGASYVWLFQYMPIGTNYDLDLMVTPEQHAQLRKRMWEIMKDREIFMLDFWNSGTAVHGCLSGGRQGGYFYITWNGDVTPCVFVPYAGANIYGIYESGGNLLDLMEVDFFEEIRNWQKDYAYKKRAQERKNLILPCLIRDHFDVFDELVEKYDPKPINSEAKRALEDPSYAQGLLSYEKECHKILDPVWEDQYLKGNKGTNLLP